MWWRQYTLRNAPLHKLAQLRDKIINGDFDMGPFQFEIELTQHRMNDKWLEHKHEDCKKTEIKMKKINQKS